MIAIQIGAIIFLFFILVIVYQDEYKKRRLRRKSAKLDSFWEKGAERRKSPRINAEIEVLYEVLSSNATQKRSTISRNISSGGINLALNEKLLPGTILDIQFNLPQSQRPISTQGEIVWIKEIPDNYNSAAQNEQKLFSAGIRFIKINLKDEALLNSFINQRKGHNNGL